MEIRKFGNPQSDIVLIQPVDDHDLEGIEGEFAEIVGKCEKSFYLLAVRIKDWNKELSPWKAPAVTSAEEVSEETEAKTIPDTADGEMKEIPGSAERKEEATPARAEENKHEKGAANESQRLLGIRID